MKIKTAKEIVNEYADYELMEDYSGRGMFGKTTTAIVVPSRDDVGYLKKKLENEKDIELSSDNYAMDYLVY